MVTASEALTATWRPSPAGFRRTKPSSPVSSRTDPSTESRVVTPPSWASTMRGVRAPTSVRSVVGAASPPASEALPPPAVGVPHAESASAPAPRRATARRFVTMVLVRCMAAAYELARTLLNEAGVGRGRVRRGRTGRDAGRGLGRRGRARRGAGRLGRSATGSWRQQLAISPPRAAIRRRPTPAHAEPPPATPARRQLTRHQLAQNGPRAAPAHTEPAPAPSETGRGPVGSRPGGAQTLCGWAGLLLGS